MPGQTTVEYYDVFNGDADGICALHQLRMAEPRPTAELITGVKRDIRLLDRLVGTRNGEITVFDISLDANRQSLEKLLPHNLVRYIDHHFAGKLPDSPNLVAHIDQHPETCTSLIVDHMLAGRFRNWAITGAFGDNLHDSAYNLALRTTLNEKELGVLRELGELLNYNGYGKSIEDLYFHPVTLYTSLKSYQDPLVFWQSSPELDTLRRGFKDDMQNSRRVKAFRQTAAGRIYLFPSSPWCRRVAGVFINEKAREQRDLAHALLVDNGDGTIMVSIRAPLANRTGADVLGRTFPGGGGRPAAAGINMLPEDLLDKFISAFDEVFG